MTTPARDLAPHTKDASGHVHLGLAPSEAHAAPIARRWASRWTVVGLTLVAVGLYVASYFLPWWEFTLFAPQYPQGLDLVIGLSGLSGDVHEIDMLNHYIGMAHLGEAAAVERQLASYGVGAVGVTVLALMLGAGKKASLLVEIPALAFPAGFVADSFFWLYRFGHHLDPHAPIHLASFTPQMFGEGTIGQFHTLAAPMIGFSLACASLGFLTVALILRRRVCAGCSAASTCGLVCPSAFVGKNAGLPPQAST